MVRTRWWLRNDHRPSDWYCSNRRLRRKCHGQRHLKGTCQLVASPETSTDLCQNTGNFAWVFWIGACVSVFTNLCTLVFFVFTKIANRRFRAPSDPATGEALVEKSKKFEFRKILTLPWTFWTIMLFSMVQTSCSNVYSQNATELAEHRFGVDAVAAGWYASLSQYAGK